MKIESVRPARGRPVLRSLLLSFPMLFLTAFMLLGGGGGLPKDPLRAIPFVLTFAYLNAMFFLMVKTGKTDRYRAAVFVPMAFLFVVSFISNLVEARGSMALTAEDMAKGEAPFCYMVIPMTLIPAALTKTIIFPGSILSGFANIASMFVIWIGASLALGRGFCSWGCCFGGLEDGFSRLLRRAKIKKIDHRWTYLPYAVLAAIVLLSAMTLSPTYCEWLCPFKTVTEFVDVTSFKILVQTGIFLSLFIGLVVVLPAATRRRTQCGLFCPMGAFQGFTNKLNPFEIRVDREKCRGCAYCSKLCPTFSLDESSMNRGKARISCTKCGKCVDDCPRGAINYHIKGTKIRFDSDTARMLFLYPAFLFLAVFGSGMIQDGLYRLLRFATTGSMIG